MSYEGYTQYICKNGHTWSEDCMTADDAEPCPECLTKAAWANMVDQTNGCEYLKGNTDDERFVDLPVNLHKQLDDCICGHIDLEPKDISCCDKCGHTLEATYKIPKKGGYKL